jgi:hypothetical protein
MAPEGLGAEEALEPHGRARALPPKYRLARKLSVPADLLPTREATQSRHQALCVQVSRPKENKTSEILSLSLYQSAA